MLVHNTLSLRGALVTCNVTETHVKSGMERCGLALHAAANKYAIVLPWYSVGLCGTCNLQEFNLPFKCQFRS